ncbi:MAG: KTSC domain-containing protein [bacterium]|nr:KTSC domain-containing protein [bacterium]
MIEWIPVSDSERIIAEAYLEEAETILVRFPDGVEWAYSECPLHIWEEFTAPGQSRGQYIAQVLDHKPHGRWEG